MSGRHGSSDSMVRQILQESARQVTAYLETVLERHADAPARLLESIRYSATAGGKRLRPTLVLETFRACASLHYHPTISSVSALAAGGAVELIHTFSLVHDDLPVMDDDDLRRGIPTNHKVFGEAMALLAGDAMVSMAFELIVRDALPLHAAPLVRELARATGPEGMIGGQVMDMAAEGQKLTLEQLEALHGKKTGALLTCACRMGAICADASAEILQAVTEYGRHLGLAFQIVDDLLDATASAQQMGKATGKDAGKGKNTYVGLLGVEASWKLARLQIAYAEAATKPLGQAAAGLIALAGFVVDRQS